MLIGALLSLIGPLASPIVRAESQVWIAEWTALDPRSIPLDMEQPEARTRWDFRAVAGADRWTRTLIADPGAGVTDRREALAGLAIDVWEDSSAGGAAEGWLVPQRDPTLGDSARREARLIRRDRAGVKHLSRIGYRRIGAGWLLLPSGSRQVVLQRAIVVDEGARTLELVHRWVDPRFGVVAEVRGPVGPDGEERARVTFAAVLDKVVAGQEPLRLYPGEIDHPVLFRLAWGYDRGAVPIASLTPEGHANAGALIAAGAWDFSSTGAANSIAEIASTNTLIDATATCNYNQCGFNIPGAHLAREDRDFDDPESVVTTSSVTEREQRASDVTVWLRAGVRNEGVSGGVGEGESRFCFTESGRTEVPLWRFGHPDGADWFMQAGDAWGHTPFACEQSIFNHVCPSACGLFCPIYLYACQDHAGTQSTEVLGEGPVTLPSGHTFDALLLRNVNDFCVSLGSSCAFNVDRVRTVVLLWNVPQIGTVARMLSEQFVSDIDSFTTVAETDIKYGLFPPLAIALQSAGTNSLSIAWDPGLAPGRIDGYKIYWGTQSGAAAPYAFNSFDNAGQVTVAGTTATISGLLPGTEYFVTVTSLADYTDPSTGSTGHYESLLLPLSTRGGTPFPAEIQATTLGGVCQPTVEVQGLVLERIAGGVQACWSAVDDPCATGYRILGSDDPQSDAGFATVAETGDVTCETFDSERAFFLVVGRSDAGEGPWGHYGR